MILNQLLNSSLALIVSMICQIGIMILCFEGKKRVLFLVSFHDNVFDLNYVVFNPQYVDNGAEPACKFSCSFC